MIRIREKNTGLSYESWKHSGLLEGIENEELFISVLNETIDIAANDLSNINLDTSIIMVIRDLYLRGVLPNVPVVYEKYKKFNVRVTFEDDLVFAVGAINAQTEIDWIKRNEFVRHYLEGEYNSIYE